MSKEANALGLKKSALEEIVVLVLVTEEVSLR